MAVYTEGSKRMISGANAALVMGAAGASLGGSVVAAVCAVGGVFGPRGTFLGKIVGTAAGAAVGGAIGGICGFVVGVCGPLDNNLKGV